MMIPSKSLLALALTGVGAVQGLVCESAPVLPDGWEKLDDVPNPLHLMRLSIALREPDIIQLNERFANREHFQGNSTPHLSREEAYDLRTPDKDEVDGVMDWLRWHSLASVTQDKAWVHVLTTVGAAEKLLDTKLGYYSFEGRKRVVRTQEYSVPDDIADTISFIYPLANFMQPRKELGSKVEAIVEDIKDFFGIEKRARAPCYDIVTPDCLRSLYNFPSNITNTNTSVNVGVVGFLDQYANYEDVYTFLNGTKSKSKQFSVELVNGGENLQDISKSGEEAALDLEYALPLAYPSDVTFYSVAGRGPQLNDEGALISEEYADNEPYLEFLDYLLEKPDEELPQVLSVSYADLETSVPRAYAERVCSMFGLLAARGTTVVAGSGDAGAKGTNNSTCQANDGSNKLITVSVFPASCPWVLSVGAVTNDVSPPKGASFSGGGFSQYFPRESWQDDVVEGYVEELGVTLNGFYNASMRAVPDISAVGTNFAVRYQGDVGALQGTSASTPVIASMLALINEARIKKGKQTLGWMNDLLYTDKVQAVLQDITEGRSTSCTFKGIGSPGGWPAKKGWDGISGLGVPNDFQKFMDVLVEA